MIYIILQLCLFDLRDFRSIAWRVKGIMDDPYIKE